jgi:WD40 repeat protein
MRAVLDNLDSEGFISMAKVLDLTATGESDVARLTSLRKLRREVAKAAEIAGQSFDFVVDSDKRADPADRRCWFTGESPTRRQLADLSRAEARGDARERTIPPEMAQVVPAPAVRVYVSYQASSERDRKSAEDFIDRLASALKSVERVIEISSTGARGMGSRNPASAPWGRQDLVVILASADYLADPPEPISELCLCRYHLQVLRPFSPGASADGLDLQTAQGADRPYAAANSTTRDRIIGDTVAALRRMASAPCGHAGSPPAARLSQLDVVAQYARRSTLTSHRTEVADEKVPPEFAAIALEDNALRDRSSATAPTTGADGTERLDAVGRLIEWTIDAEAPPMCVILGDLGMGKTTTTKLFTQALLAKHDADALAPLPVLFDFRDFDVSALGPAPNLERILDLLVDSTDSLGAKPTGRQILETVQRGGCVLVFDGLDEVLVKMDRAQGNRFTSLLWRAITPLPGAEPRTDVLLPKLVLTCRTHYFRDLRDQLGYFTGRSREGIRAQDYVAFAMLPFSEDQIRRYLAANLPGADVNRLMDTIAAVHNLRDLAQRPLLLRLLSGQLAEVEAAIAAGRAVTALDLYDGFVWQWLDRDDGKHTLLPDHKKILMERLAGAMWASGESRWPAPKIEGWLLREMASEPEWQLAYSTRLPDLWKEDLRTATFIVRGEDDGFGFAHTSIREYFLARHLIRSLALGLEATTAAWATPRPSRETFDFIGQLLQRADDRDSLIDTLGILAGRADTAAENAFWYAVTVGTRYPRHHLGRTRLAGVSLGGLALSPGDFPEGLSRADLSGCSLRDAEFTGLNLRTASLRGADLTRAVFDRCDVTGLDLQATTLVGAVFRHCQGRPGSVDDAHAQRTQVISARGADALPALRGLVIAPYSGSPGHRRLTAFTGHFGPVWAVAYSPDGTRLATAGDDGSTRIWDPETGTELTHLTGHTSAVQAVAYSPDGTRLATASNDGSTRIWDPETGTELTHLTGHTSAVWAVAYSPDGTRLATASNDGSTRIWDPETGTELTHLTGHTSAVRAVAYSPDGTRLATASIDGSTRIWDPETGTELTHLTGHTSAVRAVAYSPDGTRLATASNDGSTRIWDPETGTELTHLTGHTSAVRAVAYSPDGTRLATASNDGSTRIWDPETGTELTHLTGHTSAVRAVAYSPDGTRLATASNDGSTRIWDPETGTELTHLTGHTSAVWAVAYSPDGTRLATASNDGSTRIWDPETGTELTHLTGHTSAVWAVAYSPDGTRLATASNDGSTRIWDPETGTELTHLTGHTSAVWAVAYSPDGTRLATASIDGSTRIWDPETGTELTHLTGHTSAVQAVAYSPDGTRLATASIDGSTRIWDPETGTELTHLTGHTSAVWAVAYSPDGTRLATASIDGSTRIWDPETGTELTHLTGHTSAVRAVAYSPDGTRLATASNDGSTRIWDPETGTELTHLTGHTSAVWAVAYSPDGTLLATASNDGSTRIWDPDSGEPVRLRWEFYRGGDWTLWDPETEELLGATDRAWRYLGWQTPGTAERLPAEWFGPLPSAPTLVASETT